MEKVKKRLIILTFLIFNILPFLTLAFAAMLPNEITFKGVGITNWKISDIVWLDNFKEIFNSEYNFIWSALGRTFILCLITVAIVIIISNVTSYILTRYNFKLRDILSKLVLLGYILPPIILVIPFMAFQKTMQFNNNYFFLVLPYTALTLPIAIWLMQWYYHLIPNEIDKITDLDNIKGIKKFWLGYYDYIKYGVVSIIIFTFILTWNDVAFSELLSGDDGNKTLAVLIQQRVLIDEVEVKKSTFAAISLIISLISSVCIGILLYFVESKTDKMVNNLYE